MIKNVCKTKTFPKKNSVLSDCLTKITYTSERLLFTAALYDLAFWFCWITLMMIFPFSIFYLFFGLHVPRSLCNLLQIECPQWDCLVWKTLVRKPSAGLLCTVNGKCKARIRLGYKDAYTQRCVTTNIHPFWRVAVLDCHLTWGSMFTCRDEQTQLGCDFCLNSHLKAARAEEAATQRRSHIQFYIFLH